MVTSGRSVSLDVTDRNDTLALISKLQPDFIIHTAALNPGQNTDDMLVVNVDGARNVAEAAAAAGARLVHVSSDMVHAGDLAPYQDDAQPAPLNPYGYSKAGGEAAVAEVDPSAAIVRTSLIYGLEEIDRGTESFVKRLEAGQLLVLFNDVVRQPIWIDSLVEALLKLLTIDYGGTLNVAGGQALTREEFGRRMLDWWQIDTRGLLRSGRAADVSATIPLDLRMVTGRAERLLGMKFPGVDEVLAAAATSP